jgi:hypothetical protein
MPASATPTKPLEKEGKWPMSENEFETITETEFWDQGRMLPPLTRLGSPDGPGAFICSEPWSTRLCTIVGKRDHSYGVYVALKGANHLQGVSRQALR